MPSCANDWLLGTLLRDSWHFDGYVTADCDADASAQSNPTTPYHNLTSGEVVAAVLGAGADVDCETFVPENANASLAAGDITVADIDRVLHRLFRVRFRLGNFDPPGPLSTIPIEGTLCSPYAVELARDGARQGSVLLKNSFGTLPLQASAYSRAAIIGPNYNLSYAIAKYYGPSHPCGMQFPTIVDAIAQFLPAAGFTVLAGVPSVSSNDTSGIPAAVAAAAAADVVFLAIGTDLSVEAEGLDRVSVALSTGQTELVAAVARAAKGPVVVVHFSGGAEDLSPLLNDTNVGAILHVGQPSVQVLGVADVLFGSTPAGVPVSPAGRMTQTTFSASWATEQASIFDFGMRPGPSIFPPGSNPGRTYRCVCVW